MSGYNTQDSFLIARRISTNRQLRKLAASGYLEKDAQALRALGNLALRGAKGFMKHPIRYGFNTYLGYSGLTQGIDVGKSWMRQQNPNGSPLVTSDGHAKSTAANAWKTIGAIGDWLWLIPGVGWIPSAVIGIGANALGNAIQNRADKRLAESQARLAQSGIDLTPSVGSGNDKPHWSKDWGSQDDK